MVRARDIPNYLPRVGSFPVMAKLPPAQVFRTEAMEKSGEAQARPVPEAG